MVKSPLLTLEIHAEADVVMARQRARLLAELFGFDLQEQTRISTAVSEVARNAFQYASRGRVQFFLERDEQDEREHLAVRVSDRGAGIADLAAILGGSYRSKTGMGIGLRGARKLMDRFEVVSTSEGTVVELSKARPPRGEGRLDVRALTAALAAQVSRSPLDEVRQQNQDLLRALEELRAREEELVRVNRELSETTTGVLALYAALEDQADVLRGTSALKARFHSQMNHEIRTPIHSILSLSELLLNGTVAPVDKAQEKPLGFIRKAAQQLSELVDDLLDLAKVEAGKMAVRRDRFSLTETFGALRGMFRPLHRNREVRLVFEDVSALPPLYTDEGKLSQVLRNFISNALKFTERGEVRVAAALDGERVVFSVRDTGLGISAADQALLFRDFSQIENARQRSVRGTGLGLALVRDLARLLAGEVSVVSEEGKGSTFRLTVPLVLPDEPSEDATASPAAAGEPHALRGTASEPPERVGERASSGAGRSHELPNERPDERTPSVTRSGLHPTGLAPATRIPVMVLANQLSVFRTYEKLLARSAFKVLPVSSSTVARQLVESGQLQILIFDGDQVSERNWQLIEHLRAPSPGGEGGQRDVAILMVSSAGQRERAERAKVSAFSAQPVRSEWLLASLRAVTRSEGPPRGVLIIDDDAAARYELRAALGDLSVPVLEAGSGAEGLEQARAHRPQLFFLDLTMPGMDGFSVLAQLKEDSSTRDIPVVVHSARHLSADERVWLAGMTVELLDKTSALTERIPALARALRDVGLAPSPFDAGAPRDASDPS